MSRVIRPVLAALTAGVAALLLGCWVYAAQCRDGEAWIHLGENRDGWWVVAADRTSFVVARTRLVDLDAMDDRQVRAFAGEPRFVDRNRLGFRWGAGTWEELGPVRGSQCRGPKYAAESAGRCRMVGVPALPLVAALAIGPAAYWARRARAGRRRRAGRCVRCGYDLRATASRCPECGQPTG